MHEVNGRAALVTAMQDCPDIIIMDIEMPEMDGIEATRAIRRLEIDSQPTIIGYTSLPLEEIRDICIGAGMNDVVAKDIDPHEFLHRIRLWLGWKSPLSCRKTRGGDLDLEDFVGEMFGDRNMALSILNRFMDSGERYLEEIERAERKGDDESLYRAAHALKGGALNVRAGNLAEAACALENMVKRGVREEIEQRIGDTRLAFDTLHRYVGSLNRKGA